MPLPSIALLLAGLAATAAPAGTAEIDRLGDADPAVRREARAALEQLGVDARDALEAAAEHPSPAVASVAVRLMRRLDLAGSARAETLDPALVRAAVRARSDDPQERRAALQNLAADPAYAAPLLARLMLDASDDELAEFGVALRELNAIHSWDAPGRHDRPALIAHLLDAGPRGREVAARWLRASDNASVDTSVAVGLLEDATLQAWVEGDPDARLSDAYVVEGNVRRAVEGARRVLLGLPPIDDPAIPADVRALLETLAKAGDLDASLQLPPEAAGDRPLTRLAAAALNARPDALDAAVDALDMADLLAALFERGDYVAFANADQLPRWADDAVMQNQVQATKRYYEQWLLEGDWRPNADNPALGRYHDLRAAAVEDASSDAARRLSELDPAEAAWAALAQDDPPPSESTHPALDDAQRRLATLDLLWAARPDDTAWAPQELRRIATLAMLEPRQANQILRQVADRLDDLGEHAAAARCYAAMVALTADPWYAESLRKTFRPSIARLQPAAGVLAGAGGLRSSRSRLAVAAGDLVRADVEQAQAYAILPALSSTTIDWVRALDAAGETARADAAFAKQFERLGEQMTAFPASPMLRNEMAWLASRCKRRLSTALTYARRAVQSEATTSYLDTLAEVHAAAGEASAAERMMELALERADETSYGLYARRAREVAATAAAEGAD